MNQNDNNNEDYMIILWVYGIPGQIYGNVEIVCIYIFIFTYYGQYRHILMICIHT